MTIPKKFIIEGIDRLGKDTLIHEIQRTFGHHLVIHYSKPPKTSFYSPTDNHPAERVHQEASFRTMFHLLCDNNYPNIICNRAHLGEYVYAPLYRGYTGDYVFELETSADARLMSQVRLVLLVEDFDIGRHFIDDGNSLGGIETRRKEQELFLEALGKSHMRDKRIICVTDQTTGEFKTKAAILREAVS